MKKIILQLLTTFTLFANPEHPAYYDQVPQPVFDQNSDFIELYWQAWDYAYKNIYKKSGVPASPFMNEGFSDSDIWIWDTCFMVHFCRYSPKLFPGIESLDNFYKPIHDGASSTLRIHILTNPPLFAWTELQYFKMTGDKERILKLLTKTKYLQKHFDWFNTVKANKTTLPANNPRPNPVKLWQHEKGYIWEGGRSGMDNTPRGYVDSTGKALKGGPQRPNNPNMLWIDAISQQALTAKCIVDLAKSIHSPKHNLTKIIENYSPKYQQLKDTINQFYWCNSDNFYYDIHKNRLNPKDQANFSKRFMKVKTVASYWPMLAKIPNKRQANELMKRIKDPNNFGGDRPWVTVARDEPNFVSHDGDYWRGSIWLPTAYMGIKALENYGYHQLADETAYKLVQQMANTYKNYQPATIWECYQPNQDLPANHRGHRVRQNFCGWSALGPISLFIENILGFHQINASKKEVHWRHYQSGKHGINNLRFGNITTDIISDGNTVKVKSNSPYSLIINKKRYAVKKGQTTIKITPEKRR